MFGDYEGSRLEFLKILVELGEEPAFLQRSRHVTEVVKQLHDQLRSQRNRYLRSPAAHLDALASRLHKDWSILGSYLTKPEDFHFYESLFNQWKSVQKPQTVSPLNIWFRSARGNLDRFHGAVDRFNCSWTRYLDRLDLASVNQVLEDYNVYYPMEKLCAFGSEDIERLGFNATRPVTRDELEVEYPSIVLPALRYK